MARTERPPEWADPDTWRAEFTASGPAWLVDDPEGTTMRGLDPEQQIANWRRCMDDFGRQRGLVAVREVRHHPQLQGDQFGRVYRTDTWWRRILRRLRRWEIRLAQRV